MKKILILTSSFYPGTGGTASILDIHENLSKMGYSVFLGTTSIFKKNSNAIDLSFIRRIEAFNNFKSFLRFIYLNLLWFFNFFKYRKLTLKISKYDYILIAGSYEIDFIKYIKSFNSNIILNHPADYVLMMQWLFDKIDIKKYKEYLSFFENVLFQSKFQMIDCYDNTHLNNLTYINPVCNEKIIDSVLETDNLKISKFYDPKLLNLVIVGSVIPRKNQLLFYDILNQVNLEICLHLVGKTPDKNYLTELQMKISQKNKVKVLIHGYSEDFLFHIKYSDVLVNFSTNEGISRTLREGLYMGKNIIYSDIPGSKELIGNFGYKVSLEDTNEIKKIINELYLKRGKEKFVNEVKEYYKFKYGVKKFQIQLKSLFC